MQEIRRFRPSTVSRRLSVVAGFYRTCVIDGALQQSPADHVRRPNAPAESPTLGLTHLQFEAMLHTARLSTNPNDFALVVMLGLWASGSSKPPEPASKTSAKSTDTGSCGYTAKATKSSSSHYRQL